MCSNWVSPSGGFSLNAGPVSVGKRACIYLDIMPIQVTVQTHLVWLIRQV
jgi:hypothetical protein